MFNKAKIIYNTQVVWNRDTERLTTQFVFLCFIQTEFWWHESISHIVELKIMYLYI